MHTEVDDAYEGRGLGSRLVGQALAQMKGQGVAGLRYCPFVRSYLERHPELQDLVPAADRERFDLG